MSNNQLDKVISQFKDQAPSMVKTNKGALIGAVLGYLLTDNEQFKSTVLGALAGAVLVDGTKQKADPEDE